jgi:hypothetical protein
MSIQNIKQINIILPEKQKEIEQILQIIDNFTPEENLLMLQIGSDTIISCKNNIQSNGLNDISVSLENKLTESHTKELDKLNKNILKLETEINSQKQYFVHYKEQENERVEKEMTKTLAIKIETYECIKNLTETEINNLKDIVLIKDKELLELKEQLKTNELERNLMIYEEVNKEREKVNSILNERDKYYMTIKDEFEKGRVAFETANNTKKSLVSLGKTGEQNFKSLAEIAFRDFDNFELIDVHSIGGQGDFHLQFKEFTILVDAKLYSNKVNSVSREKIKRDLNNNAHMTFAWLVSMDTMIDVYDKAPFMFEWLSGNKCVCYINSLQKNEEPIELLRAIYFVCKNLYTLVCSEEIEDNQISLLKDNELKMKEKIMKLQKISKERDSIIKQLKTTFDKQDIMILELLNQDTNTNMNTQLEKYKTKIDDNFGIIVDWWNKNIEAETENDSKLKSTIIWNKFKKDNELLTTISVEYFKEVICSLIPETDIFKQTRAKNSAIEINNIKWKVEPIKIETEKVLSNKILSDKIIPKINIKNFINNVI